MKVKFLKNTFWFQAGKIYDIDTQVALQHIGLGDAEEVKKEKPVTETKIDEGAKARRTKSE
jgi:hypothetical protein